MTSTLRGVGGEGKKEMFLDLGGGGLASVLDVQSLFFIKENWVFAVDRQHTKPNIKILVTRNLPFDPDARQ